MNKVKSSLSFILVLSMLVMLLPAIPVFALDTAVIKITYTGGATKNAQGEYEVKKGDTIPLSISVDGMPNILGVSLYLYHAPGVTRLDDTLTWTMPEPEKWEDMGTHAVPTTAWQFSNPRVLRTFPQLKAAANPATYADSLSLFDINYKVTGDVGDPVQFYLPNIDEDPSGATGDELVQPWNFYWYYPTAYSEVNDNGNWDTWPVPYGSTYRSQYGIIQTNGTWYGGVSDVNTANVTFDFPKFKIVEDEEPEKTLTGLSIGTGADAPTATYNVGDSFDFATGKVVATYDDSTTADLALNAENVVVKGFDSSAATASQTITVEYTEGGVTKEATYNVAINAVKTLNSISIGTGADAPKATYNVGDTFDFATGKVIATYSDATTAGLALDAENVVVSGFDSSAATASQTITVAYTEDGVTKDATYNVAINAVKTLDSISIGTGANAPKASYIVGQLFDNSVGSIVAHYSDGDVTVPLNDAKVSVSGFNSTSAVTGQVITVNYTDDAYGTKTDTFTIDILAKAVSSIAITGTPKASYEQFQPIDDTTVVEVTYNDSSKENKTLADCNTDFNSDVIGTEKTVTVTYGGAQTAYIIDVVARTTIDSIVVNSPKAEYYVGDAFDATSTVTVNYAYGAAGTVTLADCTVSGFDSSTAAASQTITVTYGGKQTDYTVAILAPSAFELLINNSSATDIKVIDTLNLEAVTDDSSSGYTFQFGYKEYDELGDPANLTIASDTALASFDVSSEAPGKYYAVVKVIKGANTETLLRKFVIEDIARKGEVLVNGYGAEINLPKLPYYKGINISYSGTGTGETYSIEYRQFDFAGELVPTEEFGTATSKDFPEFLDGSKNNTYFAVVFIKDAEGNVTSKTMKYFVVANSDITATINVNDFDYTKSEFPVARVGSTLDLSANTNKAPADLLYSYRLIPWDAESLSGEGYMPTAWSSDPTQQLDTTTYAAGTYKVILYVKYEGSTRANWDTTFWRQFVVLSNTAIRGTANVAIGNGAVLSDQFVSIAKGPATDPGRNITASLDVVNFTTAPSATIPATTKFAYKLVPYTDADAPHTPVSGDWTSATSVSIPVENVALGTYRLNVYVSEDDGATVSQVIYRKYVKVVDTTVTGNIMINGVVYAGKFDPALSKAANQADTIDLAFDELTSDSVAGTEYKFEIRTFDNVATSVPETAWSTTPSVTGLDISALPVNTYLVKVSVKHGDNAGSTPDKVYFKQFFKITQ